MEILGALFTVVLPSIVLFIATPLLIFFWGCFDDSLQLIKTTDNSAGWEQFLLRIGPTGTIIIVLGALWASADNRSSEDALMIAQVAGLVALVAGAGVMWVIFRTALRFRFPASGLIVAVLWSTVVLFLTDMCGLTDTRAPYVLADLIYGPMTDYVP